MNKIIRLLTLSKAQRKHFIRAKLQNMCSALLEYINTSPLNINIGYKPDSFVHLMNFTEIALLKMRFVLHNRRNNNGDLSRLYSLMLNLNQLEADRVIGDFAELGVYKGNTAAVLAHYALRQNRRCFLFDTFSGFDSKDLVGIDADKDTYDFSDTSIARVLEVIGDCSCIEVVQGRFPESLRGQHHTSCYAAVSLDCDLFEPMKSGLEFFYPRLSAGGTLFIHDYSSGLWPGVKEAVDSFFKDLPEFPVLLPDKSGTAIIRKVAIET